jgi:hypothetical protein
MSFTVYRGIGNSKQFVAGPFPDQATADIQAQALSTLDTAAIIQIMNHNNGGGKKTSVASYVRPHVGIPSPLSQGARTQDNDT